MGGRNAEEADLSVAFDTWRRDSRHHDLIEGLEDGELTADDLQWAVIRRAFIAGATRRQGELDDLVAAAKAAIRFMNPYPERSPQAIAVMSLLAAIEATRG